MATRHFYLLCLLPDLGSFGSMPPVSTQELASCVAESGGPAEIVRALLLHDDLLQREAVLAGETAPEHTGLAVLSLKQAQAEESLPDFLISPQEEEGSSSRNPIAVDTIWRRYFQHTSGIARSTRSRFLRAWVKFEVGLRNALARTRAMALELDPEPYMVAQGLGDPDGPFETIVAGWTAASNPLDALETLDRARWNWLTERQQWYSFSDDEVAAYTAKVMILHRWQRIAGTA